MIDYDLLEKRMTQDGYAGEALAKTIEDIKRMDPDVADDFELWLNTGEVTRKVLDGFSIPLFMEKYGMKAPGAFIMMDWLIKDSASAKAAISGFMVRK